MTLGRFACEKAFGAAPGALAPSISSRHAVHSCRAVATGEAAAARGKKTALEHLSVRQRQPTHLEPWLARAAASPLPPFRRFARGLRADYGAVQAAVTLPWSQGPIEGHINRLKMLKRQMFGRAHLDLLSRRFLRTARARQARAVGPRASSPVHAEAQAA